MNKIVVAAAVLTVLAVGAIAIARAQSFDSGIRTMRPSSLTFNSDNGTVFTIDATGRITLGPGYSPGDASDAFLRVLGPQLRAMMDCPK